MLVNFVLHFFIFYWFKIKFKSMWVPWKWSNMELHPLTRFMHIHAFITGTESWRFLFRPGILLRYTNLNPCCHVFGGQLWKNFVGYSLGWRFRWSCLGYMQAMARDWELFEEEDIQLKTQLSQVMEVLMIASTIPHRLLQRELFSSAHLLGFLSNHGVPCGFHPLP